MLLKSLMTGEVHYHLWFVYMVFGLYLITPILAKFINSASKTTIQSYFLFWFIATILPPFMKQFLGWEIGFAHYFQLHEYVGFYLLGYYLHHNPIKVNYLVYLLIPVNVLLNIYFTSQMSYELAKTDFFFLNRFSIFNVINAILLFNLFRQIPWEQWVKTEKNKTLLSQVSLLSYGIFLCHPLVIWLFDKGYLGVQLIGYQLNGAWVHVSTGFPVILLVVCIVSFISTKSKL